MKEKPDIFILAAGSHRRWGNDIKHLVFIEGKSLIARTIDMLCGPYDVYVVTHEEKIAEVCDCNIINPFNRESSLNSLASCETHWKNRIICLLGDVVFSPEAIEVILESEEELQFFGTTEEIFAFVFNIKLKDYILESINTVVKMMGVGEFGAKFWYLYHYICGKNPDPQLGYVNGPFNFIEDYTWDMDTPERYKQFLEENSWAR